MQHYNRHLPNHRRNGFYGEPIPELTSEILGPLARDLSWTRRKNFGDSLKSKNLIAQKNELFCKAIAYNITVLIHEMFELGIKPDFIPSPLVTVS